jgi:hypothetical protein
MAHILDLVGHPSPHPIRCLPFDPTGLGNRYLRTLLIDGARAATRVVERKRDARSIWLSRLKLRGGPNVATVALANKNARVMWALLARGDSYRVRTDTAAAA